MAEILARRTAHSKVFDDPPGENQYRSVIHAAEIHYLDNVDEWQDAAGLTDQGTIVTRDKRVQFGIVNGYIGTWVTGHHLGFRPWKIAYLDSSSGQTQVLADADYSDASVDGNVGTVHNVFPGSIDLQAQFAPRRMRKRFRIPALPSFPDPVTYGMNPATTYLVFGYEVDNASGLTFINDATDEPFPLDELVLADIRLENAQSEEKLRLLRGQAVGSSQYGVKAYPVYYLRSAQIPFGEAIAYTDLQAADYPLIVDPSPTIYAGEEDGEIWDATFVDTGADVSGCGIYSGDVFRYYCRFNLGSISATDTCDSAVLDVWATQKAGSATITPKVYTTDWGPTLEAGDHGQAGSAQSGKTLASISTGAYNSWDLTEADVEAKFNGYCSFEVQGSNESSGDNIVEFQTADYTGTTHDPKMEITHSSGGVDVTLTAGADALSLTGQTATVTVTTVIDVDLTAAVGSLTLTGQAAAVTATTVIDVALTAATGSVVLTGQAAAVTVTTVIDVALTSAAGSLTLAGQVAVVTTTSQVDVALTAAVGSLSLTGQTATVTAGSEAFHNDGIAPYNAAKEYAMTAFDFDTDAWAVALLTGSYTPAATHDTWGDVSGQEASGYTQQALGGLAVTTEGTEGKWDANNVTFGDPIDTDAAYLVIVQGTAGALNGSDKLFGFSKLKADSSEVTIRQGGLVINWPTDGIWRLN